LLTKLYWNIKIINIKKIGAISKLGEKLNIADIYGKN
jgi:hypothetical protein